MTAVRVVPTTVAAVTAEYAHFYRIVEDVSELHRSSAEGLCVECGKPWPCRTKELLEGRD